MQVEVVLNPHINTRKSIAVVEEIVVGTNALGFFLQKIALREF